MRIGRGYDLSKVTREQAESDLKAAGLSAIQIQTYEGAVGLTGVAARGYLDQLSYGALYSEGQKAGLKGADLAKYISERTPQTITLAQQKSLFETSYARSEEQARKAIPDYDSFPAPAREAIADMVHDRGLEQLKLTRPGFLEHVAKKDWGIAAVMSKRRGAGLKRNQAIRQLFEAAAQNVAVKNP